MGMSVCLIYVYVRLQVQGLRVYVYIRQTTGAHDKTIAKQKHLGYKKYVQGGSGQHCKQVDATKNF